MVRFHGWTCNGINNTVVASLSSLLRARCLLLLGIIGRPVWGCRDQIWVKQNLVQH
jgi:hypothetical protein